MQVHFQSERTRAVNSFPMATSEMAFWVTCGNPESLDIEEREKDAEKGEK